MLPKDKKKERKDYVVCGRLQTPALTGRLELSRLLMLLDLLSSAPNCSSGRTWCTYIEAGHGLDVALKLSSLPNGPKSTADCVSHFLSYQIPKFIGHWEGLVQSELEVRRSMRGPHKHSGTRSPDVSEVDNYYNFA
jgi:hypothetical protein